MLRIFSRILFDVTSLFLVLIFFCRVEETSEASTSTENYINETSKDEFVVCKNGDYASATIDAEGAICETNRTASPSSASEMSAVENIDTLREKLATVKLADIIKYLTAGIKSNIRADLNIALLRVRWTRLNA